MSRRIGVLVNPTSGRGRVSRHAAGVLRDLAGRGNDVVVIESSSAADAERRLAAAVAGGGLDTVVAVGGDGTVHLALQAVAGTPTRLGIVALGTCNDAARELGVPVGDPAAAVATILAGHARAFDTGVVQAADGTRRHFLCVLSTGFDSLVNERANRMRWPSGEARYILAMLAELRTFRAIDYRIEVDGEQLDQAAMIVSLGNGPAYGGGMRVCPNADLHDGLLTMVWMSPMSRPELLRVFPLVYSGRHLANPRIHERLAGTVTLDARDQVAYADGERIGPLPVTVRAEPASVHVLVPAAGAHDRPRGRSGR